MNWRFHRNVVRLLTEIVVGLDHVEAQLVVLNENIGVKLMATMQDILDEVTQEGTIADSILVIVQRLASETDPATRQQLLDQLKANRVKLEAAVLAGTPQETPTP